MPSVDDAGLALHMDASEVTLNMALGGEHSGGFLIFRGVRGTGSERVVSHRVRVRPGWAIVHVGQHWHEAETLDGGVGKRYAANISLRFVDLTFFFHCMSICLDTLIFSPRHF